MVEPGLECVASVLVRGEWVPVGPVLLHGAVEAFGFAVLPWAVRAGQDVFRVEYVQGVLEVVGSTVVEGVVGHDAADRDAVAGEELGRGQ